MVLFAWLFQPLKFTGLWEAFLTGSEFVSQAEYARQHEVSRKTVTLWKAKGFVKLEGNKVDVIATDQILRNKGIGRYRDEVPPVAEVTDEEAELVALDDHTTLHEAQRLKEIELARKHRLQRLQLEGDLLDRGEVERTQFELARQERDALLAWPAQVHALMAVDLGIDGGKLSATLEKYVRQYLSDRARDIDSSAGVVSGDDA